MIASVIFAFSVFLLRLFLLGPVLSSQRFSYRSNQGPGTTLVVQPAIDIFQVPDEIQHFTSAIGAAGGRAKVSATSKRTGRIDSTTLIAGIQKWAAPIGRLFQSLTAASSPCARSEQRFTPRNVRNLTRKFEPAAIGSPETETLDRPIRVFSFVPCPETIPNFTAIAAKNIAGQAATKVSLESDDSRDDVGRPVPGRQVTRPKILPEAYSC